MANLHMTKSGPLPYPAWDCKVGIDPLIVWGQATDWLDFPDTAKTARRSFAMRFSLPSFAPANPPESLPGPEIYQAYSLNQMQSDALFNGLKTGKPRDTSARLELAMPMGPNRQRDGVFKPLFIGPKSKTDRVSLVFLGVIDDGCPYAREDFVRRSATGIASRVQYLWDQDNSLTNSPSINIPYGKEINLSLARLDVIGEDEVYAAADYEPARRANTHGSHVLSLLAGKKVARQRLTDPSTQNPYLSGLDPNEAASNADIGFVQLPTDAIADTSGLWLTHYVLDAVDYLLAAASAHDTVILNISYGPLQGPHDGSSFFEEALDAKIAKWQSTYPNKRLEVVLPSGNNFDTRTHAQFEVTRNKPATLTWMIPPGSEKSAFLEVWMDAPKSPDKVKIKLVTPNGEHISCGVDSEQYLRDSAGNIYAGLIFTGNPARSTEGLHALIVTTPTEASNQTRALAPAGRWLIEVSYEGQGQCAAWVYIARNGVTLLRKRRGRQSYFLDPQYDRERYLRPQQDDDPTKDSLIKRRGTLSGIATGWRSVIASGFRLRNVDSPEYGYAATVRGPQVIRDHPGYSSAGRGRGALQRDPDVSAPTDYSWALKGLPAGGGRGRSVFWMVGTSTAAPQVARALVNLPFTALAFRLPRSGSYTNSLYSTKYVK